MSQVHGQAHYGVSSSRDKIQEGFIDNYQMPNLTAYNETCANICNSMFSYRMMALRGQSKYADVMELVLYNSALSGISLQGTDYFYANPLRMVHNSRNFSGRKDVTEFPKRLPYLACFCCPPNLVRTIAKVSGWAYSLSKNGVVVNLYGGNVLNTKLLDGSTLKLTQTTNYPWEGSVNITVDDCKKGAFEILLRIPEWAEGTTIKVNDEAIKATIEAGTYTKIKRRWQKGDVISMEMPMDINFIEGNQRIEEVRNQVAIKRGPVVYCIETPDLPHRTDILNVYISSNTELKPTYRADFLGGVTTIDGNVLLRSDKKSKAMYRKIKKPTLTPYQTQFVPYYAWSNRGLAEMTVFMPVVWE